MGYCGGCKGSLRGVAPAFFPASIKAAEPLCVGWRPAGLKVCICFVLLQCCHLKRKGLFRVDFRVEFWVELWTGRIDHWILCTRYRCRELRYKWLKMALRPQIFPAVFFGAAIVFKPIGYFQARPRVTLNCTLNWSGPYFERCRSSTLPTVQPGTIRCLVRDTPKRRLKLTCIQDVFPRMLCNSIYLRFRQCSFVLSGFVKRKLGKLKLLQVIQEVQQQICSKQKFSVKQACILSGLWVFLVLGFCS